MDVVTLSAARADAAKRHVARGSVPHTTQRLRPLLTEPLMSSPPVFTDSGTGTTLSNSSLIGAFTHPTMFRFSGPVVNVSSYALPKGVHQPSVTEPNGGAAGLEVEFQFDGQDFEIFHNDQATSMYRMWVDDVPVTSGLVSLPTSAASARHLRVTFPNRASRRIRLETQAFYFGGIRCAVTDSVAPPSTPAAPSVALVGDSYGVGTGATSTATAYARILGRLLGWNIWASPSQGSTGFVATNGGAAYKYRDRLAYDVFPYAPDAIILQGSINDRSSNSGVSAAALTTEVVTTIDACLAALPKTQLILTSHLYCGSDPGALGTTLTDAYGAMVAAAALRPTVAFIDTRSPTNWWTGSGKVGATAGNGTADYYMSSDGVHPSDDGHLYNAQRLAERILTFDPTR